MLDATRDQAPTASDGATPPAAPAPVRGSLRAAENRLLAMIATGAPLRAVLEELVRSIEAQAPGMLGSVLIHDDGKLHHGAAPSLPAAYNRAIDGVAIGPSVGSCGTAAYRKEPVVVADVQTDPLWADFRGLAAEHGLRACWSTPIMSRDGRVLGTFAMYYRTVRRPTARHRELIGVATHLAGIAIEHAQAEEQRVRLAREQAARREAEEQAAIHVRLNAELRELADARDRARREAETARQRLAFLAEASRELASSLDYATTLAAVARLAVPRFADWCAVDVLEPDGAVRRLAVAHADPARVRLAEEIARRYPEDPNAPTGVPAVLRTGKAELYPVITDEMLGAGARDAEHLRLARELGLHSAMTVPMAARGRVLGALTLVWAESGRRYDDDDLAAAGELAQRAALAVDNARLHGEALAARARAEAESARMRALFEQAPAAIAVLRGPELVYELANGPYLRSIGREGADGVVGRPARELVGGERLARLERVFASGDAWAGAAEWVPYLAVRPYHGADGAVEGVVVLGVDPAALG